MRKISSVFLSFFLLTAHDARPTGVFAATAPTIRVAILQDIPAARVTVLGPCRLTDLRTGALIGNWPNLKWQEVQVGNGGLRIGGTSVNAQAVLLEPVRGEILRINARPYRGSLIFYRTSAGKLTIVNQLDLEEYLVGALASEVGFNWPLEALKAHAVVSRTMVAHRIWIQRDRPFDVTADVSTHLYHGVSSEREETRAAGKATKGQVLAYAGEVLSATFHANCGGHTEDASELWEVKGDPTPLKGRPDPYCRDLKHFRWRANISTKAFGDLLQKEGQPIGEIQSYEILERNASGRVRSIRFVGSQGTMTLTGRKFRELLGANRLKSLNFTLALSPRGVSFDGFGWGHGVGLCQWGAYGMAVQGSQMDDILSFYFPGAERRKLQGLPGFTAA